MADLLEELREQLLVLGVDPSDDRLAECAIVCARARLDAESFAERWVAFSLTGGGLRPEPRHLRAFEKTLGGGAPAEAPPGPRSVEAIAAIPEYLADPTATAEIHQESESAALKSDNSQTKKYSSRTNSGEVVAEFGDPESLKRRVWSNTSGVSAETTTVPNEAGAVLTRKAMCGFELLQNKASLLDNNIKYLSQFILRGRNIQETAPVRVKSQIPVNAFGRIDCDSDGRLNSKSALLQGTWEDSQGHSVPVNLEQVKEYSLFPGQTVVMSGMNPHGDKFTAHEIYCDASLPKSKPIALHQSIEGPLHIVAACGPFMPSDCLIYDPLFDLVEYVARNKPHVVILIGPFLDANHQSLTEDPPNETYKTIFEKLLEKISVDVAKSSSHTQIVLISSARDAFHANIYPTPPYHPRKMHANITVSSDPCLLNISGVNVGITATDILMHLSKEEISFPVQGPDKLGRLAGHLIKQQSFYPLWPPYKRLPVDAALWSEHVGMNASPHILIVPSDFRYFVKDIDDCLVVNPERLTKGIGAGTFMRMQINSGDCVKDSVLCEILRI